MMWEHNNSRYKDFLFSISITSSCPTVVPIIKDILGNNYTFQNLCPNEEYSVAIRTTDIKINKSSVYSDFVEFSTEPGIPSAPLYVRGTLNFNTKEFIITWHPPSELNAVITRYKVQWSFIIPCNSDDPELKSDEVDANLFELKKPLDTLDVKNFFACVRAVTSNNSTGFWGTNNLQEALSVVRGIDDCSTLTIVACIAGLAVLSSVLMVIILSISICQYKYLNGNDSKRHGQ